MISSKQLSSAYNYLYEEMRKYIWEFSTVQLLAEIETGCYTAFPDISELKHKCEKLQQIIRPISREDEELKESIEQLIDLLNTEDSIYLKLHQVQEAI